MASKCMMALQLTMLSLTVMSLLLFASSSYLNMDFNQQYIIKEERNITNTNISCDTKERINEHQPTQLIYNMVPKCGSKGFRAILSKLKKKNAFRANERKYVEDCITVPYHLSLDGIHHTVQHEILTEAEPWIYFGHLHFIDFQKYNYSIKPVYINIIRDPIERLASFYYYRRDRKYFFPKPLKAVVNSLKNDSASARKKMRFDDCVKKKDIECHDWRFIFQMISFFCGQDPLCIHPTEEALAQAKQNVQKHFAVVGYLEKYQEFLEILEPMFPLYFSGAVSLHKDLSDKQGAVHQTRNKRPILPETREILLQRTDIQLEYRFYKFVVQRFDEQYKKFKRCNNS